MRRREFLLGMGGAVASAIAARAAARGPCRGNVERTVRRWLFASRRSCPPWSQGCVDGQTVATEYLWAAGRYELLPAMAVELVNRPVAVLLAGGSIWSTISAKAAAATIPIVFSAASDPVKFGFVTSLNRPGGNVTGVTFLALSLSGSVWNWALNWCPGRSLSDLSDGQASRDTRQTGKSSRVPLLHSEEKYCFSISGTSANLNRRSQRRSANMLAS